MQNHTLKCLPQLVGMAAAAAAAAAAAPAVSVGTMMAGPED